MQAVTTDHPGSNGQGSALPSRVLIVEDEHLVATELAKQLTSIGIEVVGLAASAAAAIDLAKAESPELALVDIRLSDGDDLGAAEQIQRDLGIPVVLVSAYSDESYVRRGAELGVYGYLLKPVSADQLRVGVSVAWAAFNERNRLGGEVGELKSALADRKLIERAKGMLMEKAGHSEPDAMRLLQRHARNTRRRLAEVARAVIDSGELLDDQGGESE